MNTASQNLRKLNLTAGFLHLASLFAVLINIIAPKGQADAAAPGFVYGIVISLYILFNCFAFVQWFQYRAKGKWADYIYGERRYIVLSFVAKSLLAWQIFAGALAL